MNNLYDFYKRQCDRWAEKKLFDHTISYGETLVLAQRRAAYLQKHFRKGDVIGILAENSAEWCITYMAITSSGCIVLPLDTNLPADSYDRLIASVDTKAVFVSPDCSGRIHSVPEFAVALDQNLSPADDFRYVDLGLDDIASLVFTSGTTGTPKSVMISHRNAVMTPIATSDYLLYPDDHFICVLPLFHVYAFIANFIGPFAAGCTLVFIRSLKGPDIINALAADQFSCFPAAPQLWELFFDAILSKVKAQSAFKYRFFLFMLNHARLLNALGFSWLTGKVFSPVRGIFGPRMRFFISGGAPLKKKYFNYYRAVGLPIVEGYGLTETTGPIMLSNRLETIGKKYKPGTVGKTMRGNVMHIKNKNADGMGEIWLKGDSVSPGYYKNDQANREAYDAEGFFNTGDIGYVDKDGDLFLTGRKKNTIVLDSGKNVYPDEIEAYLRQSELVYDVCVFGKKFDGKETVCAVIVPLRKGPGSFAEIKAAVDGLNRGLPPYKRIMKIAVSFDDLPKNSTRKTLVNEVVKLFADGAFQTDASSDGPVLRNRLEGKSVREEEILACMKKHLRTTDLYANNTYTDVGLDSLGLIELIGFLEESIHISIDVSKAQSMETLAQFLSYAGSCVPKNGLSIDDDIINGERRTSIRTFYNPFNELFVLFVWILSRRLWKLEIRGRENLFAENVIIAANHQSFLDVLWVYAAVPRCRRRALYVVGKSELSFLRFLLWGSPVIFVERQGNVIPALKASADVLKGGKSLVIFPEGTRSETGALGKFKNGAAYLSKNLGRDIIPVSVTGSKDVLPKGAWVPRISGKIHGRVVAGEPVSPSMFATAELLNDELKRRISLLMNESDHG